MGYDWKLRDSSGFSDWAKGLWDSGPGDYVKGYVSDIGDLLNGGSYSDFARSRDDAMDGWYSTVMDAVPFVRNVHNALLKRDEASDYLDNNNLSWKDAQGYNIAKLTSGISSNLGGALATSSKYLTNIHNDLGKLYSKG